MSMVLGSVRSVTSVLPAASTERRSRGSISGLAAAGQVERHHIGLQRAEMAFAGAGGIEIEFIDAAARRDPSTEPAMSKSRRVWSTPSMVTFTEPARS